MSEPIRVLQVVTHMNRGGLETMLMNYYRQMERERVQFDFLVHRAARAAYDDEIEALGGKIYRLPRLVPWSASYHRELDDFFAVHKEYNIVHVHQDCLSAVALKAAEKAGVPVRLAHSHSSSQDKDWKYPIKLLYKRRIPCYATALFACGKEAGDWMFGGAPYRVLNNAIDAKAYRYDAQQAAAMREQLGVAPDALVVGHVGRFSQVKNHAFLLEIFAKLKEKRPDARLLLVGDGEHRPATEQKAEQLGLADSVIFTGVRGDVPALMGAMDVFAFPSLYEGLPLTLVEAQAAGLPCVISDTIPGECKLTELVTALELTRSPEDWAEQILSAAKQARTDTFEQIAAAGYDIKQNARWLQEYYWNKDAEN